MPTVSFPLDYLRRLTDIPPAQLEEEAFRYGLDATLRESDLEVEVTAERPDLLAAEGFTRAINIYQGQIRTVPDYLEASDRVVQVSEAVLPLRPYIAALVIEEIHLEAAGLASLVQFQEKVSQTFGRQRQKIAIGIYDLDQITGDLHYTAVPKDQLRFVPLNSDRPLTAQQILSEHPSGRLYCHTLPEADTVPVLQDASGRVLSLPPIINAAEIGEVTPNTRNLFIDVTGISPKTVREMINILAHNFLDTGATVKTVKIEHPEATWVTPDLTRQPVTFSARYLNEILGTAIPKVQLGQTLAKMDLQVSGTDVIWVPTYRTDLFSEVDVAGDLMVAIGLDHLAPEPTALKFHTGSAEPLRAFVFQVGDLAQRMGLMEVKSFVLSDPDVLSRFASDFVETGNAKSRTQSAARSTLQAGLLDILAHNINAPKPINIYETGELVSLGETGQVTETFYWGFASLDAKASFATAKAYVQTLLKALHVPYELVVCQDGRYISGRAATVMIAGHCAGHFGEIHPRLLHQFSFPEPVCAGELDCQQLMAARQAG
jgi:phenylalanyl-tRNA synthetase beta chain